MHDPLSHCVNGDTDENQQRNAVQRTERGAPSTDWSCVRIFFIVIFLRSKTANISSMIFFATIYWNSVLKSVKQLNTYLALQITTKVMHFISTNAPTQRFWLKQQTPHLQPDGAHNLVRSHLTIYLHFVYCKCNWYSLNSASTRYTHVFGSLMKIAWSNGIPTCAHLFTEQ